MSHVTEAELVEIVPDLRALARIVTPDEVSSIAPAELSSVEQPWFASLHAMHCIAGSGDPD
jgi:hypothetical protein